MLKAPLSSIAVHQLVRSTVLTGTVFFKPYIVNVGIFELLPGKM